MYFFKSGTNDVATITGMFGLFITFFGVTSLLFRDKVFVSETLIASILGYLIGPHATNLINPFAWGVDLNDFVLQFSQVLMATQCCAVGVLLRRHFWLKYKWSLAILVGPVMICTWLVTTVILYYVLGIPIKEALLIGACTAPTDPVLANSITSGKFADIYMSVPTRDVLSAESAANDGLAIALFSFSILLFEHPPLEMLKIFVLQGILYQIGLSIIVGITIGLLSKYLLEFAYRKSTVERRSFLCFVFGMSLVTVGICTVFGLAAIFACLIAGIAFSWDGWYDKEGQDHDVTSVIDLLMNILFFLYFGSSFPWKLIEATGFSYATLTGVAVLILVLRRLPFVLVLYKFLGIKDLSLKEAAFAGWFGPTGCSALWYMAAGTLEVHDTKYLVPLCSYIVLVSVILHGISAPFTHLFIHGIHHTKNIRMERKERKRAKAEISAKKALDDADGSSDEAIPLDLIEASILSISVDTLVGNQLIIPVSK